MPPPQPPSQGGPRLDRVHDRACVIRRLLPLALQSALLDHCLGLKDVHSLRASPHPSNTPLFSLETSPAPDQPPHPVFLLAEVGWRRLSRKPSLTHCKRRQRTARWVPHWLRCG